MSVTDTCPTTHRPDILPTPAHHSPVEAVDTALIKYYPTYVGKNYPLLMPARGPSVTFLPCIKRPFAYSTSSQLDGVRNERRCSSWQIATSYPRETQMSLHDRLSDDLKQAMKARDNRGHLLGLLETVAAVRAKRQCLPKQALRLFCFFDYFYQINSFLAKRCLH